MLSIFTFRGDAHSSRRRFLVLGIFCLYSLSNAMQWLTYSPIPTQVRAYYDISTTQLNMLSTIYMIIYIGLSIVSCVGLERIGLRWCLLIGTGLNFIGALLKLFCGFPTGSYAVLFVAQLINALSQIFVLSVPPSLALTWFKEDDRGTATAVGAVANAFGCAIGMLVPPLWVKDGVDLNEGFNKLFGLQLALCAGAFIGVVFGVPSTTMGTAKVGDAEAEGQMRATPPAAGTSERPITNANIPPPPGVATNNVLTSPSPTLGSVEGGDDRRRFISPTTTSSTVVGGGGGGQHSLPIASPSGIGPIDLYSSPEAERSMNNLRPPAAEAEVQIAGEVPTTTTASSTEDPSPTGSAATSLEPVAEPTSVVGVFKALFYLTIDRDSVLCVLGLSVSIGTVWAVNSLLAQLLAPINIAEADAGQMGFWNIIAGAIVALFAGAIVDKYRVYKWPIVGLAALNLICLSLIILMIYVDTTAIGDSASRTSTIAIYTLNVLAGIPQNVITPVGFEFLMELSYGHPGSVSGGMLMAIANAVSLIEVSIGSVLLGDDPIAPKGNALNTFWLIWALLIAGLVCLLLPRNNLKRLAAQRMAAAAEGGAVGSSEGGVVGTGTKNDAVGGESNRNPAAVAANTSTVDMRAAAVDEANADDDQGAPRRRDDAIAVDDLI